MGEGSSQHATEPSAPPPGGARRWYHIAGLALGLALSVSLGYMLVTRWRQLPPETLRVSWPVLVAVVPLYLAQALFVAVQWRALVRALGAPISFTEAVYTRCLPQLGKYVPGKVMLVVGQVYLTARQGAGVRTATMATVYEQAFAVGGAAGVALLSGLCAGMPGLAAHRVPLLVACVLGAACLHPRVVRLLLRWLARLMPSVGALEPLSTRATVVLLGRYAATWAVLGVFSFVLARGFHPLPLRYLPDVAGIVTLATMVGYLAVVVPAGVGVRDAGISVLLSAYMPVPLAIAIALAQRVVYTTAEVLAALLALALRPRCRALAAVRAASASQGLDAAAPLAATTEATG